jgi:hypothetical protein
LNRRLAPRHRLLFGVGFGVLVICHE